MSQIFEKTFQAILDEEMKRSIFASFSTLKNIPGTSKDELDRYKPYFTEATQNIEKNANYKAARKGDIPIDTLKKMSLSAFDNATMELRSKIEFLFDLLKEKS